MCMTYRSAITKKFIVRNRKKGWVWGYKILKKAGDSLNSTIYNYKWKIGLNISNRTNSYCYLNFTIDDTDIYEGIHVYLSTKYNRYKAPIFIKVRCFLKDLVGCGDGRAVFKQVYLSKKEYNRYLKYKRLIYGTKMSNM